MDNGASSYRRFLNGDESAFDDIMKELFNNLVFFINGYVHDVYAAEDIAIDVFSDLIVHKHRYNFKVTLKTYLFMIGRSRALNYIKHRKVIDFVELTESDETMDEQENLESYEKLLRKTSLLVKYSKNVRADRLVLEKEYSKAIKVMEKIKPKNCYEEVLLSYKLGKCYIGLGDGQQAKSFLDFVLKNGNNTGIKEKVLEFI